MIRNNKGFTLIELLVSISIISLLSTVTLSSVNEAKSRARDAQRVQDFIQIRNALALYANDHDGKYPAPFGSEVSPSLIIGGAGIPQTTSSWSLNNFWNITSGDFIKDQLLAGGYISKMPVDPLNNASYFYSYQLVRVSTGSVCFSGTPGPPCQPYAYQYNIIGYLENPNHPLSCAKKGSIKMKLYSVEESPASFDYCNSTYGGSNYLNLFTI